MSRILYLIFCGVLICGFNGFGLHGKLPMNIVSDGNSNSIFEKSHLTSLAIAKASQSQNLKSPISKKDLQKKYAQQRQAALGYEEKYQWNEARKLLKKNLNLAVQMESDSLTARSQIDLGRMDMYLGKLDSAFYFLKEGILSSERSDTLMLGETYKMFGFLYLLKFDNRKALEGFMYAGSFASDSLGNLPENFDTLIQDVVWQGEIFWGNRDGNLNYFRNYLEDYQKGLIPDRSELKELGLLTYLAHWELEWNYFKLATNRLSDLIDRAKELKSEGLHIYFLQKRSEAYSKMGNYELAKQDYQAAMKLSQKSSYPYFIQNSLVQLGSIYNDLGKEDSVRMICEKILAIQDETGTIADAQKAYKLLHSYYKNIGNYKSALEIFEKYIEVRDSLDIRGNEWFQFSRAFSRIYGNKSHSDSLALMEKNQAEIAEQELIYVQKRNRTLLISGALLAVLMIGVIFYYFNQKKKQAQLRAERAAFALQSSESETKALRSQMNPHFIFNALRSIQTYILKEQPEAANDYLLKFSRLMRNVLENSRHETVPVEDDLETLGLYMELERIRFKFPFEYTIETGATVNAEDDDIPPLILQPFVENAIWHGLRPLSRKGHIAIRIEKEEDMLRCTIEDDGVGREAFKNVGRFDSLKRESLGLKITEQRLAVMERRTGRKCSYKILDLVAPDGGAAGTRVALEIPLTL